MASLKRPPLSATQIFTIVAVIIIVIAVIIWSTASPKPAINNEPAPSPVESDQQTPEEQAPPIETPTDLQEAETTLESVELEELDTSELDELENELP